MPNDKVAKSFTCEIQNDKEKFKQYIETAIKAGNPILRPEELEKADAEQLKASCEIIQRVLLLIGAGGLEITNSSGEKREASENNLPVSTYLAHGSRILVEIPQNTGDSLINWITSGDNEISGISRKQSQQGAIAEGKIVYNRSAATHDVTREKQGENYTFREKKGFVIGAQSFVSNKVFRQETNHFGVDLALDADGFSKPDGDHGHLYIHYKQPTSDKTGSILIGIENAAPSSSKHSKTGASDPVSVIGGCKFRDLVHKITNEKVIIPKTIGGMKISLAKEALEEITKMNVRNYGAKIAYAMPAESPKAFIEKFKAEEFHSKIPTDNDSPESLNKSTIVPSTTRKSSNRNAMRIESSNRNAMKI